MVKVQECPILLFIASPGHYEVRQPMGSHPTGTHFTVKYVCHKYTRVSISYISQLYW